MLDGIVPGCNTAAAPPSSARCRARRGLPQLPGISGPLPCPPTSASPRLYRARAARVTSAMCGRHPCARIGVGASRPAQHDRLRLHGRPRAAMQANTSCAVVRNQQAGAHNIIKLKSAASPSHSSASRPAFTLPGGTSTYWRPDARNSTWLTKPRYTPTSRRGTPTTSSSLRPRSAAFRRTTCTAPTSSTRTFRSKRT